jgi:hypothetical protein
MKRNLEIIFNIYERVYMTISILVGGHAVAWLHDALCYGSEGRGLKTRCSQLILFNLLNPSGRTRPWGLLSL